jgi:hypothetical protein
MTPCRGTPTRRIIETLRMLGFSYFYPADSTVMQLDYVQIVNPPDPSDKLAPW